MDEQGIDFRLENDSSMIISGPSKCGKTTFVIDLLHHKDRLFRHPIRCVYWFHGAAQGAVHRMLCDRMGVVMKEGVPTEDDFEPIQQYDLVILDDLQDEMKTNRHITSLFLKQSHHRQFFVILLQQNIYGDSEQRFRNANVHYWVAFNNPRNQRQVGEFLSRMYPSGGQRAIQSIFKHVLETEGNYGYLFVDFTPNMRSDLRLRSHVFTSPMHIYKVTSGGGFNEWLALSTLTEEPGSDMTYDTMVLIPKARYHAMVGGGASQREIKALMEPKKAYVEDLAREVLEHKITPDTVQDFYTKLIQFDKNRTDFFFPKVKAPEAATKALPVTHPPPPPPPPPSRPMDMKQEKKKIKSLEKRQLLLHKQSAERFLKRLKQPPSRLRGRRQNVFEEYAQLRLS